MCNWLVPRIEKHTWEDNYAESKLLELNIKLCYVLLFVKKLSIFKGYLKYTFVFKVQFTNL